MKNIPSPSASSLDNFMGAFGRMSRRITLGALLGMAACTPQKTEKDVSAEIKTTIDDKKATEIAEQSVKDEYKKLYKGAEKAPLFTKKSVFRKGQNEFNTTFLSTYRNARDKYPAILSVRPDDVIMVYLEFSSGNLMVAIDSTTGRFIAMEYDN